MFAFDPATQNQHKEIPNKEYNIHFLNLKKWIHIPHLHFDADRDDGV
jgi:hypothetical protein